MPEPAATGEEARVRRYLTRAQQMTTKLTGDRVDALLSYLELLD